MLREKEVKQAYRVNFLTISLKFFFSMNPMLVSLTGFAVYCALGKTLVAAVAFPALTLFDQLRFPLTMVPRQVAQVVTARVSVNRIEAFFAMEEMTPSHQHSRKSSVPIGAVQVSDATFTWGSLREKPTLRNISLVIDPGWLVIIIGEVGSGKSSLLAALLGEMRKENGEVLMSGSVAYTSQDTWIANATVRDNILMGRPFDADRYQGVLRACALEADLQILPGGDHSEIGEKGINLSGGQKHRVALARAAYGDSDLVLLDDPLSAVDAHVGRHLFDACIRGLMVAKTRLLVTHQLQYVPFADRVVLFKDGRVSEFDTYEALQRKGVDISGIGVGEDENDVETETTATTEEADLSADQSVVRQESSVFNSSTARPWRSAGPYRNTTRDRQEYHGILTKAEKREKGAVKQGVYQQYIRSFGQSYKIGFIIFTLYTTASAFRGVKDWWIARWSEDMVHSAKGTNNAFYITIYGTLTMAVMIFTFLRSYVLLSGTMAAARKVGLSCEHGMGMQRHAVGPVLAECLLDVLAVTRQTSRQCFSHADGIL
eukprot:scaffold2004_cov420-Prasinococcus_capsulatus_cf.AAC.4